MYFLETLHKVSRSYIRRKTCSFLVKQLKSTVTDEILKKTENELTLEIPFRNI